MFNNCINVIKSVGLSNKNVYPTQKDVESYKRKIEKKKFYEKTEKILSDERRKKCRLYIQFVYNMNYNLLGIFFYWAYV